MPAIVHDFTASKLSWGWNYNFINGGLDWFSAVGWGEGLEVGHQIKVTLKRTTEVRYRIKEIKYKRDPTDMWDARFVRVDEPDNPQEP